MSAARHIAAAEREIFTFSRLAEFCTCARTRKADRPRRRQLADLHRQGAARQCARCGRRSRDRTAGRDRVRQLPDRCRRQCARDCRRHCQAAARPRQPDFGASAVHLTKPRRARPGIVNDSGHAARVGSRRKWRGCHRGARHRAPDRCSCGQAQRKAAADP